MKTLKPYGLIALLSLVLALPAQSQSRSQISFVDKPASDTLTLAQAQTLMLEHHPGLKACRQDPEIALALRRQQAKPQLPGIDLEAEDFGPAAASQQQFLQYTLSVSQTLSLTERPKLTLELGELEAKAADAACQQQARELSLNLANLYFEGLYWQERLELAKRQQHDAETSLGLIERQISSGKLSPLERTPPAQELTRRKLDQELAYSRLKTRLEQMASFWPGQVLNPQKLSWPPTKQVDPGQQSNPDLPELRRQQIQEQIALLETRQAEAGIIPDLRLGSGLRWHPQGQELGLNVQLGWDLPVWHQQQDALNAARLTQTRESLLTDQTRRQLNSRRSQLCMQVKELAYQVKAYEQTLLPEATAYLEQVRRGLDAGKFGTLTLLQARQQLAELEQTLLQWRIEAASTSYELQSLGGC